MLYIDTIGNGTIRFSNTEGGGGVDNYFYGNMIARSNEVGRIWIIQKREIRRSKKKSIAILNNYDVSNIRLDGEIYTAEEFVKYWNENVQQGALLNYLSKWFTIASEYIVESGRTYLVDSISSIRLESIRQNCIKTTGTQYLQSTTNLINGSKWAVEVFLSEVNTSEENVFLGETSNGNYFRLNDNGLGGLLKIRPNGSGDFFGNIDMRPYLSTKLLFISNSTSVRVYSNSVLIDTITGIADLVVNRVLNYTSSGSGYGFQGKANNFKVWDLSTYSESEIDALDFDEFLPTNWFPLSDNDSGATTAEPYSCVIGSGVTLTLSNATPSVSLSNCDGLSYNTEFGYAIINTDNKRYPVLQDGSGYVGLTGAEIGFKAFPKINEGRGYNASEQKYKAESNADLIKADNYRVFFDIDLTPKELNVADLPATNYLSVAKDSANNVSLLAVKKPKPIALAFDYNHIHVYGQSNAIGQQTYPPLTTGGITGAKMIGDSVFWNERTGTAFQDLIAVNEDRGIAGPYDETSQVYCENAGISAGQIIKRLYNRKVSDKNIIVTSEAEGGKTIEELQKGFSANYYGRIIAAATQAKANADADGKSIGCTLVLFNQGEANYRGDAYAGGTGTQDKDEYKTLVLQLFNDITSDLRSIYGQTEQPLFVINGIYGESINLDNLAISQAQLELANENTWIVYSCPQYFHFPSGRGNHMDPNSHRWNGEFDTKAYWKTLNESKFKPLQPINISVSESGAYIDFNKSGLVFDDYTTDANTDNGFEFEDDNGALVVSSMTINNNRITVQFSTAVTGVLKVRYGCQQTVGGNLRDSDESYLSVFDWQTHSYQVGYIPKQSDGITTIEGEKYPMWNWCATFYYEVDGELTIDI